MLTSLTIRNFVVAKDISLDFQPGFTVFLGETGAGKSVLVDALATVLGQKSSVSKLRDPKTKAYLEAVFDLDPGFLETHPALRDFLDGESRLILSFSLSPKGTVTRKANGETVTGSTLRELADGLCDIHSQGGNARLLTGNGQLGLLDDFGGDSLQNAKAAYRKAYGAYVAKEREIAAFKAAHSAVDPEYLAFRIEEIEKAHLKPGEIEADEDRLAALAKTAKAAQAWNELQAAYSAFQELSPSLRSGLMAFEGIDGDLDGKAQDGRDALDRLSQDLDAISSFDPDNDPAEVDRLNQRLYDLEPLRTKYGRKTQAILDALKTLKDQQDALGSYAGELAKKEGEKAGLLSKAKQAADALSQKRRQAGLALAKAVGENLEELSLPKDGFRVTVEAKPGLDGQGQDGVVFEVRMNQGGHFARLADAASGGESSRVMLAIKAVLLRKGDAQVSVFDEIDTGISGSVAFKAGLTLYRLSRCLPVMVITHLPQVAAFADQGVWVSKAVENGVAVASAKPFGEDTLYRKLGFLMAADQQNEAIDQAGKDLVSQAQAAKAKVSANG